MFWFSRQKLSENRSERLNLTFIHEVLVASSSLVQNRADLQRCLPVICSVQALKWYFWVRGVCYSAKGFTELSTIYFAVEDIKSKFKNLRTVFNREYKAVQASKAADKLYMSKWKHYHQLLFLCESCNEDHNPNEVQTLISQQEEEDEVGYRTPPVTSSSLTCCFTQTDKLKFHTATPLSSSQIDTKDNTSAPYQIFLASSPDNHKLSNQVTLPACSSETKPSAGDPDSSPQNASASSPAQLDIRLSADFRCHWTEAKVQELISFYSSRCTLLQSLKSLFLDESSKLKDHKLLFTRICCIFFKCSISICDGSGL